MFDAPPERPSADADIYAFGPFRLDATHHALYRGDDFIPVTPKALDTLLLLVENAGDLVSKDAVLQRVWPDAFVEEGSIATNISMLRKILNPHFEGDGPIATVSRRGYRFSEPVTLRKATPQRLRVSDEEVPPAPSPATRQPRRRAPIAISVAISIAIIMLMIGVTAWRMPWTPAGTPPSTPRRAVAVLPMKNLSGETAHQWLSTALAETISAELSGGNTFRVVSGENVMRMQQELALPLGVGLTRKQLDDVGRDLACDLILSGNFVVVGGKIRVDVRLDEVATGEAVASASITDTQDRFLDIVSTAGANLRTTLHLDRASGDSASAMRAAFTASPDALRNYFEGLEALRLRDGPRARDLLLAATTAEPAFALAHAQLSSAWRLLGYDTRGADSARRALELAAHLSPEDRIGVEAQYDETVGLWPKAIELYQQLWTSYPDNIEYGLKLGNAQWSGAKSSDALKTVEQLRRLPERDSRDARIDFLEGSAADLAADYARASAAVARAAERATADKATLLLARARTKQAVYATRVGKRDEAIKYLDAAEPLFASLHDTGGVADVVRWQGQVAFDQARFEDAMQQFQRAYQMVAPLGYIRLTTEIQIAMSDAARSLGDRKRAIALAEAGAALARDANNRSAEGRSYVSHGLTEKLDGDYARAREDFKKAADILGAIGELRSRNPALNNAAVIDFLLGDLDTARATFEELLVSDHKINNNSGIALRLANISRILVLQHHLDAAEKMNVEECALQASLKSATNLAWCRTRLAAIYLERGRKDDAEALAREIKSADLGSSVTSPLYLARLARLQLYLGHVDAAAAAIAAAEKVQATAGPVEEQAIHVSVIRAEVDAAQGRRAAAIARLKKAIADADRLGLKTWSLDATAVLSRYLRSS